MAEQPPDPRPDDDTTATGRRLVLLLILVAPVVLVSIGVWLALSTDSTPQEIEAAALGRWTQEVCDSLAIHVQPVAGDVDEPVDDALALELRGDPRQVGGRLAAGWERFEGAIEGLETPDTSIFAEDWWRELRDDVAAQAELLERVAAADQQAIETLLDQERPFTSFTTIPGPPELEGAVGRSATCAAIGLDDWPERAGNRARSLRSS